MKRKKGKKKEKERERRKEERKKKKKEKKRKKKERKKERFFDLSKIFGQNLTKVRAPKKNFCWRGLRGSLKFN